MSTAANRVAIFLSSVLFSFPKCTWLKIGADTVTHWSRIVAIIAFIFLIDSANPVSNRQMVQRREGALISGWKSAAFKIDSWEEGKFEAFTKLGGGCSMQSLVNLYSLQTHCRASYPPQFRWINTTWKLSRPPEKFTPSWTLFYTGWKVSKPGQFLDNLENF